MNEDLVAKLRAVKVRTPQEVMAEQEYKLVQPGTRGRYSRYEWIRYWKERELKLASMADVYAGFTAIYEMHRYGEREKADKLRGEITADFSGSNWMTTSTSIDYPTQTIEHDGSVYSKVKVTVPDLDKVRMREVDSSSLDFLRALFKTSDSLNKIVEIIEFAAGTSHVKIITPPTLDVSRFERPLRRATLFCGGYFGTNRELLVNLWATDPSSEISRGVRR